MPNRHLVRLTVAVAAGLIAGIALIHTAHAQSKVYFAPEISVGGAFTNDHVTGIDLSQTGFLFGAGVGVGVQTNMFIVEPFGRYSYMNQTGSIESASLETNNLIDLGVRLGFRATKSTNIYGLAGYAWENLDLKGLSLSTLSKNTSGLELGGGIEHSIGGSPLYVRAEYTHDFFDSQTYGGARGLKITPDLNVVRLGLTYKFGAGNAPSVFDTSAAPPAAEACDPKMFNCHSPMK